MKLNRLSNNTPQIDGVINGINVAAEIITMTMGGSGKNVLLSENEVLNFTRDGVSVAKRIKFKDPQEDIGAQLVINAANQTVNECGDGTTLTSLLTQQFVNELFALSDPINDRLDLTKSLIDETVDYLMNTSTKVNTLDDIYKVAFTSSKSEKIASLIREIYRKTGFGAAISVEQSENFNYTYHEITDGLTFDSGLLHSGFANQDSGNCSMENVQILIEDGVVADIQDYAGFIDTCHQNKQPLMIIAKGFSDAFIRYALTNKQSVGLQICLVKLPGFGDSVQQNIKDIKSFMVDGCVNKVTVTPYQFTLFNNPDKRKIKARVKTLNAQLENASEDWEAMELSKRIANLQQTSAIIYVGGRTKRNAEEEKDRIDDAVGACKVALVNGVVKGCGSALYEYAQNNIDSLPAWYYNILCRPAFKILENANINSAPSNTPFNVRTRQFDESLIDPTQVIISALRNSFALAELLINTGYTLYNAS